MQRMRQYDGVCGGQFSGAIVFLAGVLWTREKKSVVATSTLRQERSAPSNDGH
jgi:hypothetical protein